MPTHSSIVVWITKYALTKGIYSLEVEKSHITDSDLVSYRTDSSMGCTEYFHKKDYSHTKEEAVKIAEEMRIRKLKSLDKQIKKISALKFEE